MKTRFVNYAIFLMIFFVTSCSDDNNPIDVLTSVFSADVDGEEFKASTKFYNTDSGKLIITGQQLSGASIQDQIILTVAEQSEGTYPLSATELTTAIYKIGTDQSNNYVGISGEIVITSFENNKVSGTFHFEAAKNVSETISITNGTFTDVPKAGAN